MALTTWTELKASLADWTNRTDLTAVIPDFITLAEAAFTKELRYYTAFTALGAGQASNDILAKAPDVYLYGSLLQAAPYLEHDERIPIWKDQYTDAVARLNSRRDWETAAVIQAIDSWTNLKLAVGLWANRSDLVLQIPAMIQLAETEFRTKLRYYTAFTALGSGQASNDILVKAPDVYVYGTLLQLAPFLGADERVPMWRERYEEAIARLNAARDWETAAAAQAVDSWTNLKTTIGLWLNRSDMVLQIPAFITLAEARFTKELRYYTAFTALGGAQASNNILVKAPDLYVYGTLLQAAPYLGDDARIPMWREAYAEILSRLNSARDWETAAAAQALDSWANLKIAVGLWLNRSDIVLQIPAFITLAEAQFTKELRYYTAFTALGGAQASNDILAKAPDLYLYGTLLQAAPYLGDDSRIPLWKATYDASIARLNSRRDWESGAVAQAVDSWTNLKLAVGLWLNRSDMSLQIPVFIQLAEAEMKRRIRRSTSSTTIFISAANITGPTDMASPVSLKLDSAGPYSDYALKLATPQMMADIRARQGDIQSRPTHFGYWDSQLQFAPDPDQSYDGILVYNTQLTALGSAVASNTILAEAPDAYVYGTLLQAAPYLGGDERIPLWQAKFDSAITQLNQVREDESYGGSFADVRLPRVFG
ncbi:MAG: hypothetical protein O2854_07010 [Chloroflexi bacterium]|nr:hypothetical protein [Chloroflexota bacterium]